ncbi:MAG: PD-(D/E)XK nuclease family protein [Candidatus Thorarchaeota archaeon]|nr:PD-(D/E)XK nuclease family protein [Candidatus Thorarchaeota archaeon]
MTANGNDIVRREFRHGKVAYGFQWNRGTHKKLGNTDGDLAALWAHLSAVRAGNVPEAPFTDPFYRRASSLRLSKMSAARRVALRMKLMKSHAVVANLEDDLVRRIRNYHRSRGDKSYTLNHAVLPDFLQDDPNSIAIEVPVYTERYRLTGHIDLVRFVDGHVQICDYKPGPLDSTKKRFLESIPQVAAYGEMMTHHLAGTLCSALDAPFLPTVRCAIFDTHSCWHFGADMFVSLYESEMMSGF